MIRELLMNTTLIPSLFPKDVSAVKLNGIFACLEIQIKKYQLSVYLTLYISHHHCDSEFQACVAYQLASGEMPMEQEDREDLASQRMTLGLLKGHGKSKKVGSVRTAVAKSSGLAMSQGALAPSGNSRGQGFKVFCEDENAPPSMPLQTGEWSQVPAREVVNVENDQKPAKWTDSRVRTK